MINDNAQDSIVFPAVTSVSWNPEHFGNMSIMAGMPVTVNQGKT
jgi:hypothetical protein